MNRIHGLHNTPENRAWRTLKQRCENPKNPDYPNYGGRGIRVEFASFEQFLAEVGSRPTPQHSIDRIDVNGNYAPGNCRWATDAEQRRNRRDNVLVELNGVVMVLADAARTLGWKRGSTAKRVAAGKAPFRILGKRSELPESVRAELGERP